MSKKNGCPFPTMPTKRLVDVLRPAVYPNDDQHLASLLIEVKGKLHNVPVEVARALHRNLGDAIAKVDDINYHKLILGYTPKH